MSLFDIGSSLGSGFSASPLGGLSDIGALGDLATSLIGATLAEASFRGVTFSMPTSEEESGRRVVQMWFPGVDPFALQDTGALDGPMRIRGMIAGDDYMLRTLRLRQASMQAGPGTLVHPWWGELKVRVLQPLKISLDENQLGICSFEMVVVREPVTVTTLDTLTALLVQADALVDGVTLLMRDLLAPIVLPLSIATALNNSVSQIAGIWSSLSASAPEPLSSAAAAPIAQLAAGLPEPLSNTGTTYADSVTDALAGVPVAIADAVAANTPAVAPSGVSTVATADTDTTAVDPRTATTLLLSAATAIGTAGATLASGPGAAGALAVAVCARAVTLSQALATAAAISYTSQSDALAMRDTLLQAMDGLSADIVVAASGANVPTAGAGSVLPAAFSPGAAASLAAASGLALSGASLPGSLLTLMTAAIGARAAIVADISSRLGRLPAVVTVTVPRAMSAWALAYALAGDTVEDVVPMLTDLVDRNLIANPAMIAAGSVEVLEQAS
ncbi:hypothetical protein Geu3261_0126_002 [Komagataeibacter europaeus NBRC 3261]|uniref:DNA circulation N-terminal domain-containing protein n=1 Tax=Komagataeibacter europaeus NBRC 3261 TaxID=1234669 RepID=A0A0D6Q0E3_KOMEU|nr:DNA circularization N-terminal domain-containing protein [Komagataeibacter europaeus]GAN96899.1 hypothetical protein Geu3261_0126_002 [Komagataeibacter europaeus NBRC 3261]